MKLPFFLILTLLLASCSTGKSAPIDSLFQNKKTVQAQMVRVAIPSDQIMEPIVLTAVGDKLLSGDFRSDPMIAVFDMATPARTGSAQPKGKAEPELLKISSMYGVDNKLFIYNSADNKVIWRKGDSLATARPLQIHHIQKKDLLWLKMVPVAGDRYVASGLMDPEMKAQFVLLDSALQMIRYFESYPVEGMPMAALSISQQGMGFQGQMTRSPDGRRMMWTPMTGSIFRFYDFSGEEPRKLKEYLLHVASFDARAGAGYSVAQSRDNEWGVVSSTADKDHFYALYSHNLLREGSEARDIYVFNLSGKPVRKIVLDRPATRIVWVPGVDNRRGALYAFGQNAESMEPEIFRITD